MALSTCSECGKSVSTAAALCPHCGAPGPATAAKRADEEHEDRSKRLFVAMLVGVLFLGMLWGVFVSDGPEATERQASTPPVNPYAHLLSEAKAQELWQAATVQSMEAGLLRKWECSEEVGLCRFQLEPALWRQFPYDSKRDWIAAAGKSAAVLYQYPEVEAINFYSGKLLARYNARWGTLSVDE